MLMWAALIRLSGLLKKQKEERDREVGSAGIRRGLRGGLETAVGGGGGGAQMWSLYTERVYESLKGGREKMT